MSPKTNATGTNAINLSHSPSAGDADGCLPAPLLLIATSHGYDTRNDQLELRPNAAEKGPSAGGQNPTPSQCASRIVMNLSPMPS